MQQPVVFGLGQHWWPVAGRVGRQSAGRQGLVGCTVAVGHAALTVEVHLAVRVGALEVVGVVDAVNKYCHNYCILLPSYCSAVHPCGSTSHSVAADAFPHSLLCHHVNLHFCWSDPLFQSFPDHHRRIHQSGYRLHFWNHHVHLHSCFC